VKRWSAAAVCVLAIGCAKPSGAPTLAWDFEARPTYGEIRVLPVIVDIEVPALSRDSFLGTELSTSRVAQRRDRTEALATVPSEVAVALPGAVHGELGAQWAGQFRVGHYPVGGRDKVRGALRGRTDLEDALSAVAVDVGGDASLFVWVTGRRGTPLTVEGFPGETILTGGGPVLIDLGDEAYRVEARVGMALVAADGEVVLRYTDAFETVLSDGRDAATAGRDLARALAREVATVWPRDPRLASVETALRY